jgi:hypothetical protein
MVQGISDNDLSGLLAQIKARYHVRNPVSLVSFTQGNIAVAKSGTATLKTDIDASLFSLGVLYAEATFSAAANGDLTIDVRAKPPGQGDYSDEPWARGILSYNTASPYKRKMWLPFDVRQVDDLSIYYSSANSAATMVIDHIGLKLVM